jgi:nitrite reductase/ring-hydroxylating ferredoxin subunit
MSERMQLSEVDAGLEVGTVVGLEVDGAAMVALHTETGWVMTVDECPHARCEFSADGELADDGTLICHCHGSEFDAQTGELLLGPAARGISITRLRVERNTLKFG